METKFKFLKQTKIQVLIIVLLTLLAYSNIFQNEFAVDDLYLIVKWERIHNLSIIPELFVKDTLETGYTGYRPLRTTIIAILYNIFRENTFGYHLYSILVHLSSTLLVYFLARQLIQGLGFRGWGLGLEVKTKKNSTIPYTLPQRGKLRLYPIPFISALLFGLHPIHTEAITFIVASIDTTGEMFLFGSFYLYLLFKRPFKPKLMLLSSILLGVLAYLTFEITYILPLLIFAAEIILFPGKIKSRLIKAFKITLPFTLIVAIIFLIRYQVLSLGEFKVNYLAGSFYLTQVLMLKVLLKYLLLLIYPVNLSLNHVISGNFETFRVNINSFDWFIHQSILEPQPILALLIVISLTLLVFWCRKKNPLVSFSIAWLFISFLPFFNLIPQATALSERYLYVASFGFILFLCCVLFYLPKKLGFLILILLVISYGTLTYRRNFDWKYASSIWEAMLRAYPKSALANYFVGTIFEERRENDEAIYYYQRSLELNPNMDYAYNSLAYLYFKQGNSALAKNLLLQELKIQNKILDRNQTDVLLNLSESYALLSKIALKEKKFDEAFEYSQKAITVDADNQDAFLAQDLILAEKPEFKKNAALFDPKGWQQFTNKNYAFAYPINWSAEEKEGKIVLHPFKRQYEITIEKIDGFTNSDKDLFLKSQNQSFGTLVKEESAKVPDTEWAYARIWNDHEQPRLEFYISKKGIIFRVIAFPSTFALKEIFDKVIQSIQVF